MSALTLSAEDIRAIKARNIAAFRRPFLKRFSAPISIGIALAYIVFCAWFFSIAKVMSEGNWNVAGDYLADWISYEVRPDIDYRTGEIKIDFPRFSPLGENPQPDWIETRTGQVTVSQQVKAGSKVVEDGTDGHSVGNMQTSDFSFMAPSSAAANTGSAGVNSTTSETTAAEETREGIAEAFVRIGEAGTFRITPDKVTVSINGVELDIAVDPAADTVKPLGPLPVWASQKTNGAKIFIDFGFAGRAEVRSKETKIWRRYLGWENFVFDTSSPFWGKSFAEVVTLLTAGPSLEKDRSNWAIAWDNVINNAEWQHGDVWIKLLQTIVMAFVGTLFALLVAFPLSFLAARNITPNRFLNQLFKRFFDFLRSVDMLIWALFFTRAFGPGPLAGISAIFFTDTGTFGKLYSEALENIDEKQREGVRSVGANEAQVRRFGIIPQVLPVFVSQALYFWESNTRSATIIGAVGAGGIGLKLWEAMRTNQDWENVAYMVILILIVVFAFDGISNALRSRLIGRTA